jgi:hypothetical protein
MSDGTSDQLYLAIQFVARRQRRRDRAMHNGIAVRSGGASGVQSTSLGGQCSTGIS